MFCAFTEAPRNRIRSADDLRCGTVSGRAARSRSSPSLVLRLWAKTRPDVGSLGTLYTSSIQVRTAEPRQIQLCTNRSRIKITRARRQDQQRLGQFLQPLEQINVVDS